MSLVEQAIEVCRLQTGIYIRDHNLPPYIQPDDLLQEVLVRMLRYISNYDPVKGELKTFLRHHTFGAIQDYLRRCDGYKRTQGKTILTSLMAPVRDGVDAEKIADMPDSRVNIEADCIASELSEFLEIASQSIPLEYRRVIYLYYSGNKETREIGSRLCLNDERVRQIRRTALKKLLRVMRKNGIIRMSQII